MSSGLLDILSGNADKQTAIGLLMAGQQMMNTPRQGGVLGAIGNGLLGFSQGLLGQQQQEKEDARQARIDGSNLALQQAQAQYYLNSGKRGLNGSNSLHAANNGFLHMGKDGAEIITLPDGTVPLPIGADTRLAYGMSRAKNAANPIELQGEDGAPIKTTVGNAFGGVPAPQMPQQNSSLPRKVLQDGQYHDLADYIPVAQQFVPNVMQVESGGNPNAVSPVGAKGLMQVMDKTGANPGMNVIPLQNKSNAENVRFGTDYLAALLKENGGDVARALSAYNQGQGNLNKDGIDNKGYVDAVFSASPTEKVIAASQSLAHNAQQGYNAAVKAGFDPSMTKAAIHESLQTGADMFASSTPVYKGQSTKDKLALETDAKKTQDQNKANIELSQKQAETTQKKTNSAGNVVSLLDQAKPLIETATNSGAGAIVDDAMAFFGKSTQGANSAQALKALGANLVMQMPRMEGPQSDKDVQLYKEMAGQIADPWIPKARKMAAVQTIDEIQSRYLGQSTPVQQTAPSVSGGGWSIKAVE